MVSFLCENTPRKIDASGRISIPKNMKNRLGFEDGDKIDFYTITDDNGEIYIGIKVVEKAHDKGVF